MKQWYRPKTGSSMDGEFWKVWSFTDEEKKPCLFNIGDVIEGLSTGCNGDYKQWCLSFPE